MKGIIVDLGINNIQSLQHKVARLGVQVEVADRATEIDCADFILLPGVGHFGEAMSRLRDRKIIETLENRVLSDGVPILGICLGMQLFSQVSQEGDATGLGWIQAKTINLNSESKNIRIPHIGWARVKPVSSGENLFLKDIEEKKRFYFVHSYHVKCEDSRDIVSTSVYEDIEFVSCIRKNNIYGTQFHPEKSHRDGMKVVWNFLHCAGLV